MSAQTVACEGCGTQIWPEAAPLCDNCKAKAEAEKKASKKDKEEK